MKLYVVEAESAALKGLVAVCRIAWAEAHAAFSRRAREVPADAAAIEDAKRALARDWPALLVLEITQSVVEKAGEFVDTFALRTYDAVQLATAHHAMAVSDEPLVFGCFDARLKKPRVCSGWNRASVCERNPGLQSCVVAFSRRIQRAPGDATARSRATPAPQGGPILDHPRPK